MSELVQKYDNDELNEKLLKYNDAQSNMSFNESTLALIDIFLSLFK